MASRGFVATLGNGLIYRKDGIIASNSEEYTFLTKENCSDIVNAMLWNQAQLCYMNGLFLVANGIYQVRGFDASHRTIVGDERGVVLVDCLISEEYAEAALHLYRQHRGGRRVTGLIYTHPREDHLGGVQGVIEIVGNALCSSGSQQEQIRYLGSGDGEWVLPLVETKLLKTRYSRV